MLMTVLRGELAIKQSKALIRTFKKMKDYIIDNRELIGQREYIQLSMQTEKNARDISKLKSDIGSIEKQMSDVMDRLSEVVTKSDLADMMNSVENFKRLDKMCAIIHKKNYTRDKGAARNEICDSTRVGRKYRRDYRQCIVE